MIKRPNLINARTGNKIITCFELFGVSFASLQSRRRYGGGISYP